MLFVKNFLEWFVLKPKIHNRKTPPSFKDREIWWCYLGENIGSEQNGKNQSFTRPVVILKKFNKNMCLVVPCSTQIKSGDWFISLIQKNIEMVACLHQIKMIDYRRLDNKIGTLDDVDFAKVVEGFENLYKKMPLNK